MKNYPFKSAPGGATRRQQKHELLITFMANAKSPAPRQRSAPARPPLLKALLSLFI